MVMTSSVFDRESVATALHNYVSALYTRGELDRDTRELYYEVIRIYKRSGLNGMPTPAYRDVLVVLFEEASCYPEKP